MTIFEIIRRKVENNRKKFDISPLDALLLILNNLEEIQNIYTISNELGIDTDIDEIKDWLDTYKAELSRVQQLKDGNFANPEMRNGYVLSENSNNCFGTYFKRLRQKNIAEDDLIRILDECNVIVQQFLPQPSQNVDRRGLVIGQVQSGKTTIFNGLISAAADIGFNVIIILSGTIESLRRQTQSRIEEDVTAPWSSVPTNPFYFTWISNHNGPGMTVAGKANQVLTDLGNKSRRQIAIGVFLKNKSVLNNLRNWLNTINPLHLDNLKVLIIDDEADQATPNAGIRKSAVTAINQGIKDLVIFNNNNECSTQQRTSYLGFTATPFANLLNEAGNDTLYPRDFLYFLKSSLKYYGPWQLFGNPEEIEGQETIIPLNAIRLLNEKDVQETVPIRGETYNPKMAEGLRRSIIWYLLATSAIRCNDKSAWSTMLIHTSSKQSDHQKLWEIVNEFVLEFKINNGIQKYKREMQNLWEEEIHKIPEGDFRFAFPNYGQNPIAYPSYDSVYNELKYVVTDVKVKIDNSLYKGPERMQFDDDIPVKDRLQIGIGGNTLSRGITLKNLVSSYFARRVSTYDTLLQMGRWFGYRVGYELLPRLWTTVLLKEAFRDLVVMEQNLRNQMDIYLGGESLMNKAPVITQMPAMAITRKNVIGNIQVGDVNYNGTAPQTILFNNNFEWLENNINEVEYLLSSVEENLKQAPLEQSYNSNHLYYEDVSIHRIVNFLEKYNIIPGRNVFNKEHIISFINANKDDYNKWNIVVIGGSSTRKFPITQTSKNNINLNNRTRIKDEADIENLMINIKSLRSTSELLADRPDLLEKNNSKSNTELWEIRKKEKLNPVLLIYPIDKNSKGNSKLASNRAPMEGYAKNDIIGISVVMNPPNSSRRDVHGASLADIKGAYKIDEDEDGLDDMEF